MAIPSAINLNVLAMVGAVCMALLVIGIRLRSANKPTSARKILIPPLGMSTGFLMFIVPQTHIPWSYVLPALSVGFLFSYPLILTSKLEMRGQSIYLKPSKSFAFILLGLLAVRVVLHDYIQHYVTLPQTGAIFFILAFGMIAPWRLAMYMQYRKMLMKHATMN